MTVTVLPQAAAAAVFFTGVAAGAAGIVAAAVFFTGVAAGAAGIVAAAAGMYFFSQRFSLLPHKRIIFPRPPFFSHNTFQSLAS